MLQDVTALIFGELGSYLVNTLNFLFYHGELSSSHKQAVISLIQKKDRDSRSIKNWRPISLINFDTKIASKALVFRIRKLFINWCILTRQHRSKEEIYVNPLELLMTFGIYRQKNEDGILLCANIEKAFDSVDHTFVLAKLKKFGFGNQFIGWIKTLFNSASSCLVKNRFSTGSFSLERGT